MPFENLPMYAGEGFQSTVKNSFIHFDDDQGLDGSVPRSNGRSRFFTDPIDSSIGKENRCSQLTTDEELALANIPEESQNNYGSDYRRASTVSSLGQQVYESGTYIAKFSLTVPEGYTLVPNSVYQEIEFPQPTGTTKKKSAKKSAKQSNSQEIEEGCTTMMLRNIPNKLKQPDILEYICNAGFQNRYDFFYLPMDFSNMCNVGYGFINFFTHEDAMRFKEKFHDFKMSGFTSNKVCQVCPARVQGLQGNIEHYRNSPVMNLENNEWKPLIIQDGKVIPFPEPEGPIPTIRYRSNTKGKRYKKKSNPATYY